MADGELQGWYQDPFGLHEKRYISAGRPTKLVRDGQVDSYDEPPSATYEIAAVRHDEQDRGEQAYVPAAATVSGNIERPPGPAEWSPWRSASRAVMAVVVIATAAILTVIAIGGSDQPSWAKSLGAGITVDKPASTAPGHGSPGAAAYGFLAALEAKNPAALCEYVEQLANAKCPDLPAGATQSLLPSVQNIALGYTANDGTRALVGTTGTICPGVTSSPGCYTNEDPAAILSSGRPFSALWTEAINSGGNTYSLVPCINMSGNWYVYLPN